MDYENESMKFINEVDDLINSQDVFGISDVCIKINESIKVNMKKVLKKN